MPTASSSESSRVTMWTTATKTSSECSAPSSSSLDAPSSLSSTRTSSVGTTPLSTCYSRVRNLPLTVFLDPKFIHEYIKPGRLLALSERSPIDHCNVFACLPPGVLHLVLDRETHQALGLQGTTSKFKTNRGQRFNVHIDLTVAAMAPGRRLHSRLLWCLEHRIGPADLWVSCLDQHGQQLQVKFPPAPRVPSSPSSAVFCPALPSVESIPVCPVLERFAVMALPIFTPARLGLRASPLDQASTAAQAFPAFPNPTNTPAETKNTSPIATPAKEADSNRTPQHPADGPKDRAPTSAKRQRKRNKDRATSAKRQKTDIVLPSDAGSLAHKRDIPEEADGPRKKMKQSPSLPLSSSTSCSFHSSSTSFPSDLPLPLTISESPHLPTPPVDNADLPPAAANPSPAIDPSPRPSDHATGPPPPATNPSSRPYAYVTSESSSLNTPTPPPPIPPLLSLPPSHLVPLPFTTYSPNERTAQAAKGSDKELDGKEETKKELGMTGRASVTRKKKNKNKNKKQKAEDKEKEDDEEEWDDTDSNEDDEEKEIDEGLEGETEACECALNWFGLLSCRLIQALQPRDRQEREAKEEEWELNPVAGGLRRLRGADVGWPLPCHQGAGQILRFSGLLGPEFPHRLFETARKLVSNPKNGVPWAALMVWGFPGSPQSWTQQEHELTSADGGFGENDYIIIVFPDAYCLFMGLACLDTTH
eukprot:gb/GEZN01001724.1/.p1 GENE.gb/GEZN01001724.1/~~gb/GEZN01001724.1/.p1  ORF type:complete len:704 (+),score=114.59 gb/GEZN01001724.1/:562-2673(+)